MENIFFQEYVTCSPVHVVQRQRKNGGSSCETAIRGKQLSHIRVVLVASTEIDERTKNKDIRARQLYYTESNFLRQDSDVSGGVVEILDCYR